jgi:hypothetical protein
MTADRVSVHPAAGVMPIAPGSLAETGLTTELLCELAARHFIDEPLLGIDALARHLRLPLAVVAQLATALVQQGLICSAGSEQFALTKVGASLADAALLRSSYCGPAPVTLEEYTQRTFAHCVRRRPVRQQDMRAAYADVVIGDTVLDALGRSLNSERAILIQGPAGSGKTFLAQRLVRAFTDPVPIPHAVAIGDAIVPVYDPLLHEPFPGAAPGARADRRYEPCRRPGVIAGAQLSASMLDLSWDAQSRSYHAPLQLKANNGLLIIDDVGRQRLDAGALLERWNIPIETHRDWLVLADGRSFAVPFDVVLVLITDRDPEALGSEVLRRRLGHKVRLGAVTRAEYEAIWRQCCDRKGVTLDPQLIRHAIDELHERDGVDLLPCYPAELLSQMLDQARYAGSCELSVELLDHAWAACFPSAPPRAPAPVAAACLRSTPC